jgi:hypothetical protein
MPRQTARGLMYLSLACDGAPPGESWIRDRYALALPKLQKLNPSRRDEASWGGRGGGSYGTDGTLPSGSLTRGTRTSR